MSHGCLVVDRRSIKARTVLFLAAAALVAAFILAAKGASLAAPASRLVSLCGTQLC